MASTHNVYYGNSDKGRRPARPGTSSISTYGLSLQLLADLTGAHLDTVRRWKRAGVVPRHYAELVALRTTGDLGIVSHAWAGFSLRGDTLCTPTGWTIQPGEISSLPIRYQQLRIYQRLFEQQAEQVSL